MSVAFQAAKEAFEVDLRLPFAAKTSMMVASDEGNEGQGDDGGGTMTVTAVRRSD